MAKVNLGKKSVEIEKINNYEWGLNNLGVLCSSLLYEKTEAVIK